MKRHRKKSKQTAKAKPENRAQAPADAEQPSRREALTRLRNWGLLGLGVAAGGWYLVDEVTATIGEHDLSRIGNGIPAVVQIHDPRCNSCLALQKETRAALADFDDGELQYLVADINTAEGRSLASAHGVGHITLLLFDGKGKRRKILAGANTSSLLKHYFKDHLNRHGAGS